MAKAKRRSSSSGEETKARIVEATLETLQTEGIVGASARVIARAGDFNQALIFYHFGTVDEAIVAAIGELSKRRLERYRERLSSTGNLADLIAIARELHADDEASGEVTILAQAFAGASRDPEMGPALYNFLEEWTDLVAEVMETAIAASPLADHPMIGAIPRREMAMAVSGLFLGIEMMGNLDPKRANTEQIFNSISAMAQLGEAMLTANLAATD